MGTHEHLESVNVLNGVLHRRIVIGIGRCLVGADRVGVAVLRSPFALSLHICAADEFDTGDITLFGGILMYPLQVRHTVVAVHLKGGKNNCPLLIIYTHGLVGKIVDGILETVVLGIDKDPYVVVIGPLAKGKKSLLKLFVFSFLCLSEGLPLFRCF